MSRFNSTLPLASVQSMLEYAPDRSTLTCWLTFGTCTHLVTITCLASKMFKIEGLFASAYTVCGSTLQTYPLHLAHGGTERIQLPEHIAYCESCWLDVESCCCTF